MPIDMRSLHKGFGKLILDKGARRDQKHQIHLDPTALWRAPPASIWTRLVVLYTRTLLSLSHTHISHTAVSNVRIRIRAVILIEDGIACTKESDCRITGLSSLPCLQCQHHGWDVRTAKVAVPRLLLLRFAPWKHSKLLVLRLLQPTSVATVNGRSRAGWGLMGVPVFPSSSHRPHL